MSHDEKKVSCLKEFCFFDCFTASLNDAHCPQNNLDFDYAALCVNAPERDGNKHREQAQTNPPLSNGRLSAALPRILRCFLLCHGFSAAPCTETVSAWRTKKKRKVGREGGGCRRH